MTDISGYIQEPHDKKKEIAQVLNSFYVEARKKDDEFVVIFFKTMYNKTIIRFSLGLRLWLIELTSTLIIPR